MEGGRTSGARGAKWSEGASPTYLHTWKHHPSIMTSILTNGPACQNYIGAVTNWVHAVSNHLAFAHKLCKKTSFLSPFH